MLKRSYWTKNRAPGKTKLPTLQKTHVDAKKFRGMAGKVLAEKRYKQWLSEDEISYSRHKERPTPMNPPELATPISRCQAMLPLLVALIGLLTLLFLFIKNLHQKQTVRRQCRSRLPPVFGFENTGIVRGRYFP